MKKINLLFFFSMALFFACNNTAQEQGEQEDATDTTETVTNTPLTAVEASFSCRELTGDDEPLPLFEVVLDINGEAMVVDSTNACEVFAKTDYEKYDIPANAITACGGWYAGAGDYYYLVRKQDELSLMQGWQDEGQEDEGFHYVEVRKISL